MHITSSLVYQSPAISELENLFMVKNRLRIIDLVEQAAALFKEGTANVEILQLANERKNLPPRKQGAHKGNFGHVVIVGGDYSMGGAVRMAAEAALRVGAGLVSVATRSEHVAAINAARPEIMVHGIKWGWQLQKLVKRATVVVIGPGLGKSSWSKKLLNVVLRNKLPLVLDADALNLLSMSLKCRTNWILTPHPGEAARLLGISTAEVQENRLAAVTALQKVCLGVVVLKGAGTLIAAPNATIKLCNAGNPGMATAGMGDILSGIIGGLLAQGMDLALAANLGVILHATAGDVVAKEIGLRGMLALDLLPHLPKLLKY